MLASRGGDASKNLASVLIGLQSSYVEAADEYQQSIENSRRGEGYDPDFDPFEQYAQQWDAAEDFIYNEANMDAVHQELLQAVQGRNTELARSKAQSLATSQMAGYQESSSTELVKLLA